MATQTVNAGDSIRLEGVRYTVGPKCDEKTAGHWFCVTHGKHFRNNLESSSHQNEKGDHVMAWWCALDGPEVP